MRTFEDALVAVVRRNAPEVDEDELRHALANCDGVLERLADQELARRERMDVLLLVCLITVTTGLFVAAQFV